MVTVLAHVVEDEEIGSKISNCWIAHLVLFWTVSHDIKNGNVEKLVYQKRIEFWWEWHTNWCAVHLVHWVSHITSAECPKPHLGSTSIRYDCLSPAGEPARGTAGIWTSPGGDSGNTTEDIAVSAGSSYTAGNWAARRGDVVGEEPHYPEAWSQRGKPLDSHMRSHNWT